MKRLYLLRHAKSSWDDPSLSDFDRPLNGRGRKAAPFMGKLIADREIRPEIILSSPAVRARRTAELFRDAAELKCPLRFEKQIYEASLADLRTVVSELAEEFASALLVGHQPGTGELIRFLTGESPEVPTACFASVSLNVDKWADVRNGLGKLDLILRPKEEMRR
jgi:phosphohistidine phosphatase